MNRPSALSAVGKARRRSSLLHPTLAKSPRSTVRRTVTGSISRTAVPLPSTMTTGRLSAPTRSIVINTFSGKSRTGFDAPLPQSTDPRRSTLHSSRVADRTRMALNTTSRMAPTPVFGRTTTTRAQRTPVVPAVATTTRRNATTRSPPECETLRARLMELEQKCSEQSAKLVEMEKQSSMQMDQIIKLNEQNGVLTTHLDVTKIQLDHTSKALQMKTSECEEMTKQLNEKEAILRKMHNDVVDLRGQIRVAIRVRPSLESEKDKYSGIEYPAVNAIAVSQGSKPGQQFKFEKVFTPIFSQEEVFHNIEDFIQSALHGYNVGLIAFGQTGSGKTHTMRGGSDEQQGVIPRAAKFLFEESTKLQRIGWSFDFSFSAMEIYNNDAYDLLNNRGLVKVRLSNGSIALDGLTDHKLSRVADIWDLLHRSDRSRMTAATKCNEHSSRSHAVYMWTIKTIQESTGITTTSVLKLVDLAGSERAKESGVQGQQFTEMTAINASLSVLQKCVNLQKSKSKHVPYRDSKLTQVLMDCLGAGNSKTMVIVNINPVSESESKRSIEFASRMRDTHIGSAVQQRDQ